MQNRNVVVRIQVRDQRDVQAQIQEKVNNHFKLSHQITVNLADSARHVVNSHI